MADELMIEVTGASNKAEAAIDRVTKKLETLLQTFERISAPLTAFTEKMNSISAGAKAIDSIKKMTDSTQRHTLSVKDAESKMAMYQARLDRATLSINKTRVASQKLAEVQKKLNLSASMDAANQSYLNNYKYTGFSNKPSSYIPPTDTTSIATPAVGSSRLASQILSNAQNAAKRATINLNTTPAQTKLQELQAYIESLTPSVSKMSSKAQADFQNMSTKLTGLGQQIDNQRALWHKLTLAQGQAATKFGENSTQALKLEKQMLSADSALGRLIDRQDKLKAQMSQLVGGSKQASSGFFRFGKSAEDAGKKSVNGMTKLLRMVKAVTISLITFKALTAIQQGVKTGIQNIAQASSEANYYLSQISTSSLYLKNSLGAALMPVIQALTPYIVSFTDALAGLFNTIGALAARIFNGATTFTKAKKAQVDYAASLGKTTKAAKEAQRTIAGFDEINALSKPSSDSAASATPGMPDVKDMFETVPVPDWVNNVGKFTDGIGKPIAAWWASLTDPQKWGVGLGATAGSVIGGIIGKLIGGRIGAALGVVFGGIAGAAIGAWWAGLTDKQKWSAGIGAGAGAVIGGIIGGLIAGPLGVKLGALLGAGIGGIIGAWWTELTSTQKWAAGIGAGAGATIGGVIAGILTGGNPIGIAIGAALGGTIGAVIGKWWSDLTSPEKWKAGIGIGAGATIGGVIGTLIAPGIGTAIGAILGAAIGGAISSNWEKIKQWLSNIGEGIKKWSADIWRNIKGIFKEKWGEIVDFFKVDIPKWIQSVGDWFEKIPYNLGYSLGKSVAELFNFGEKCAKWISEDLGVIIGNIQAWFDELPGKIGSALSNALSKVKQWGADLIETAKTEIPKFVTFVAYELWKLPDEMLKIGENIVTGIWDGITKSARWLGDMIKDFCGGIVDGFKDNLQIHSPSRLFSDVIGKNLALGLGYGFIDNMKMVSSKMISSVPSSFSVGAKVSLSNLTDLPKLDLNTGSESITASNRFNAQNYNTPVNFTQSEASFVDRLIARIDSLEDTVKSLDLNVKLYANNREIAEASNAGNRILDRARHPVAST